MSFMYKASMARAPNKRKIKLNEQNLMQLMNSSDGDDEEDEDYTVSSRKMTDEAEGEDDEESREDTSETDQDSEDQSTGTGSEGESDDEQPGTSNQATQSKRMRRQLNPVSMTVGDLTNKLKSKHYGMSAAAQEILLQAKKLLTQSEQAVNSIMNLPKSVCSICLNEGTSSKPNSFLTCSICAVSVHQDCYNMDCYGGNKATSEIWICDACVYGGNDVVCQFCPNLYGCMKETKCGRWVHVICARSILTKFLTNCPPLSRKHASNFYIQLEELSKKHYGAKECLLCDDRLVAKTGICVKCDAGLCKSSVHITCAQKYGLLSRPKSDGYSPEAYIVNCPLHCVEEQMKKKQRLFLIERKTVELMKRNQFEDSSVEHQYERNKKLKELRDAKDKSHNSFMSPRAPLEQVPKLLSSDAHFTNLLNRKAEKMYGIDTKHPALIIPKSTEIRKKHNVPPSLTTEFAAYFMDRELRIEEEKEHLVTSMRINESLLEKQEYEKSKYNEVREKLIIAENVKTELKKECENLKCLLSSIMDTVKSGHPSDRGCKRRKLSNPRNTASPKRVSSPMSPMSSKKSIPDADSVIGLKRCGICKGRRNQHLLVKCDVCLEWQHLGCLDPPLTQMPKRTKYTLWQCSECANSSSSSSSDSEIQNRGSFICTDGRRATRRVRRVPEKLAIGFPDREMKREMVGHSKLIQEHQQKLRAAFENLARQQRFSQNKSDTPSTSNDESERKLSGSTDDSSDLRLGVSCDNYLSLAARLPIINQRCALPQSSPSPESSRRIIILKKALPVTHRSRPAGLGQMKHMPVKTNKDAQSLLKPITSCVQTGIGISKNTQSHVISSVVAMAKIPKKSNSSDTTSTVKIESRENKESEDSDDKMMIVATNLGRIQSDKTTRLTLEKTNPLTYVYNATDQKICPTDVEVDPTQQASCPNSASKSVSPFKNQEKPTTDDSATGKVEMILSKISSASKASSKIPSKASLNLASKTHGRNLPLIKTTSKAHGEKSAIQKIATVTTVCTTNTNSENSTMPIKKIITSKDIATACTGEIKTASPKKKIMYKLLTAGGSSWSAKMLTAGVLLAKDGKTLKIPSSRISPITTKRGKDTMSVKFVSKNAMSASNAMSVGEYMRKNTFRELKESTALSVTNEKDTTTSETQVKKSTNVKTVIKECSVCSSAENQTHIVQCSSCRRNYHWDCCDPPLRANPVSRYSLWECSDCVDNGGNEKKEDAVKKMESGSTVTPEGRRVTSRKRKPPDLFDPASTISDQQRIYKSIAKHRKKMESATTSVGTFIQSDLLGSATAARCRPVPIKYLPWNRTKHPPNFTRLLNLKGLKLPGLQSLAIVQKQTGPNTSVYSIVPHPKTNVPSLPPNSSEN